MDELEPENRLEEPAPEDRLFVRVHDGLAMRDLHPQLIDQEPSEAAWPAVDAR